MATVVLQIESVPYLKMRANEQQKLENTRVYFEQPSKKKNIKAKPLILMAGEQNGLGWERFFGRHPQDIRSCPLAQDLFLSALRERSEFCKQEASIQDYMSGRHHQCAPMLTSPEVSFLHCSGLTAGIHTQQKFSHFSSCVSHPRGWPPLFLFVLKGSAGSPSGSLEIKRRGIRS